MYRRSNNPAAERAAAQNQAAIKSLLKLEANKVCADCKRNKHPRWASWNIGVFICIRCSGHHRGMGTHISRVKSVDLDSWTDEQTKSMIKWGNARANKYWEAKLAPGHIPSEAKIENFIRTKYEARRWVMPGPMPDPATLDDQEEDKPEEDVEKIKAQQAADAAAAAPAPARPPAPSNRHVHQASLVDDDDIPRTLTSAPPPRPSTTNPQATPAHRHAQSQAASSASTPSARARPSDSIFGLDLFGPQASSATSGPTSTNAAAGAPRAGAGAQAGGPAQSRPDLKQSILSLYATPQLQSQPTTSTSSQTATPVSYPAASTTSIFDSLTSPPRQQQQQQQQPKTADAFSGLIDSFSGLSFPSSTSPHPATAQTHHQQRRYQSPPLSSVSSPASAAAHHSSASLAGLSGLNLNAPSKVPSAQAVRTTGVATNPWAGGGFFDAPAAKAVSPPQPLPRVPSATSASMLDEFSGFQSASPPANVPASSGAMGLVGGLSATTTSLPAQPSQPAATGSALSSLKNAFDLSQPVTSKPAPNPTPSSRPNAITSFFSRSSTSKTNTTATPTTAALASPASSAAVAAASVFPDPWASASSAAAAPAPTLNAWATSDIAPSASAAPAPAADTMRMPESLTANDFGSGWGAPNGPRAAQPARAAPVAVPAVPVVAADEDFGGWTSAGVVGEAGAGGSGSGRTGEGKGTGIGGNDDLFGNVWQ